MEDTKKIITRAVYGNRKQTFQNIVRIPAAELEKLRAVLGGTVNEARILGTSIEENDNAGIKIRVDVEFAIHIWYLTENDTKVYKVDVKSSDLIEIENQGAERFSQEDVSVWMKDKPVCIDTAIITEEEGDFVAVQLEYVLEAEAIGETLLNVRVYHNNEALETTNVTKMKYLQNF